jgi:hypothetical protein
LVSTIPASHFWKAWQLPEKDLNFEALPITFVVTKYKPDIYSGDYEMIYCDDTVPPTRMSYLHNKYCLEFTGVITREEFSELYPKLRVWDLWTLPQGRIKSQLTMPPERITFSGRFAQWQHHITTEHVVDQALNYKERNAA